jgi:citrate synthase
MSETAKLILENGEYSLPVYTGSEEEKGIDISSLRSQSGYVTLDTGYKNTGATTSAITFLDGEQGILRYRGYPIEQLAEKSSFLEVSYLLLYGELPNAKELAEFTNRITRHTLVHEDVKKFFDGYPSNAHPMGQLCSLICSLSSYYPESLNPNRPKDEVDLSIVRILAKMPTLVSWIYKKSIGHPLIPTISLITLPTSCS